ncbi:uncharacterized protein LOC102370580 [Alligator sinensis]|uniref:Uncharacterized protein LOC102370580 n=1 Tax=Alligator sinensis TaxID=38654 RepID=A0A1U7SFW5_ALLSI|nr:uncharacterized protein LOC102370580 [Alligator sinensis]XP_025072783.1 uncharacterized protein LOC102370580 [Alligator sinensis]
MAATWNQAQAVVRPEVNHQEVEKVREKIEMLDLGAINWEDFLMPAPSSVAILGEVVSNSMEQKEFKELKCLYKLSTQAENAFSNADANIENICMWFECLTEMMKDVVIKGDSVGIDDLQCKREQAEARKSAIRKTKDMFLDLIKDLQNLLDAWSKGKENCLDRQRELEQAMEQKKLIHQKIAQEKQNKEFREKQEEVSVGQMKADPILLTPDLKTEDVKSQIQQMGEDLMRDHDKHKDSFETLLKLKEKQKEIDEKIIMLKYEGNIVASLDYNLKELEKVKEKWENMGSFFQMIFYLIDSCLYWIQEYSGSNENKQQIDQAFKAFRVAHLGQVMLETYTKINEKKLFSQIKEILCMNHSDPRFCSKKKELDETCKFQKTQSNLVLKMQEEFKKKLNSMEEKIKKTDSY